MIYLDKVKGTLLRDDLRIVRQSKDRKTNRYATRRCRADFDAVMRYERRVLPSIGGRIVFDNRKNAKPRIALENNFRYSTNEGLPLYDAFCSA
jgi:hypothetical protein